MLAGGSMTVLLPPHPQGAPAYRMHGGRPLGEKRAASGPYLAPRKGRQSPCDLGRGLLHPPFCGGSGAGRNPGKVHSGNWSSRRGPGCAATQCVSHLSGASHPTPLTPAAPISPPVSRRFLPRRLPRPGPSTGCPTSPAVAAGKGCGLGPREAGGRVGSARLRWPRSAAGRGHPVLGRGQFPSAPTRRPPGSSSHALRGARPLPARPPPPRATSPAPGLATHRAGGRGSRDRRGTWELCAGRRGAVRARDSGSPRQPRPPPPEKFAALKGRRGGEGWEGRGVLESPAQEGGPAGNPGGAEERGEEPWGGGRGEAGPGNRGRVRVGVPAD